MPTQDSTLEHAKEKVLNAARAHAKACAAVEKLWNLDGEDPPDWNKRMTKKHNLMERTGKRLLKAANDYERLAKAI